jgi:hypothetical protein
MISLERPWASHLSTRSVEGIPHLRSSHSLRLGLALIAPLGSKKVFREEMPQDMKREPIEVLNQTKIDFIDRKTSRANLRKPGSLLVS